MLEFLWGQSRAEKPCVQSQGNIPVAPGLKSMKRPRGGSDTNGFAQVEGSRAALGSFTRVFFGSADR